MFKKKQEKKKYKKSISKAQANYYMNHRQEIQKKQHKYYIMRKLKAKKRSLDIEKKYFDYIFSKATTILTEDFVEEICDRILKKISIENNDFKFLSKEIKKLKQERRAIRLLWNKCPFYKKIYKKYYDMLSRCYNPKNKNYKYYHDRNITVCSEWKNSFSNFLHWCLKNGYNKINNTIDRKNYKKGYEPKNCRFVPFSYNTRYQKGVLFEPKEYSTIELWKEAKRNGNMLEYEAIKYRIRRGWSKKDIITIPVQKRVITLEVLKYLTKIKTNQYSFQKMYLRFVNDNKKNQYILMQGKKIFQEYMKKIEKEKIKKRNKIYYIERRS